MNWSHNIKRIIDVCEVIAGQSPQGKYYNKEGEGLPFYQGKKEFTNREIGEPTTWTTKTTKEAFNNDILMSVRAPVGPINIATQHICIGRGLAAIRASEKVNNDYLFYFLMKHESEIIGNIGAVFNSINKTQIGNILIPIPPLPEQKAIVKILDEAFAKIDQAKANIEKNIENAKELFQSKLNEIFSQRNALSSSKGGEVDALSLPKGWEEKKLGEIVDISSGGTPSKREPSFWGGNIPWVSPKDMKSLIIVNSRDKITSKALEEGRAKLHGIDTVLIVVRSGILSRTIPLAITKKEITINQDLKALRVNSKLIPQYLLNFLRANEPLLLLLVTRGATVHRLETPTLKQLRIIFPNKKLQTDINKLVKLLESHMTTLLKLHEKKIEDLKELKKSLLQKAFSGELTKMSEP